MAKKIDEAEVKKECPSCGLGVALDATICEFCGWDFQEEDEWILQIEKLERELMLEKQKFEPGSVEGKIESTLHTPSVEMKKVVEAKVAEDAKPAAKAPVAQHTRVQEPVRPAISEPRPPPQRAQAPPPRPPVQKAAPEPAPKAAPSPKVRRVRTVKGTSGTEASEGGGKKKLVRKVKQ